MAPPTTRPSTRLGGSLGLRLLSAVVVLPLLGLVIWAGFPWAIFLAGLVVILGLREFYGLIAVVGYKPVFWAGFLWGIALVGAGASGDGGLALMAVGVGAMVLLVFTLARGGVVQGARAWLHTSAGMLAVGLPLMTAAFLRHGEHGMEWLVLCFLAAFATDTSAYGVGRLLGRHRMAPGVSPGKTWEGAAGGAVGGVGATMGLLALLGLPWVAWAAVALGAGISLAAQVGDLAESRLKRLSGVKDSGRLIPGHGGLLDRLDSLVLVFPLVYYVAMFWPEG